MVKLNLSLDKFIITRDPGDGKGDWSGADD